MMNGLLSGIEQVFAIGVMIVFLSILFPAMFSRKQLRKMGRGFMIMVSIMGLLLINYFESVLLGGGSMFPFGGGVIVSAVFLVLRIVFWIFLARNIVRLIRGK